MKENFCTNSLLVISCYFTRIWDYGYPDHEGDNFGIFGLDELIEPYALAHPINNNSF